MRRRFGTLVLLGVLASELRADERRFTYSYEPRKLPKGTWEFEQWAPLRTQKDTGSYFAVDLREEIATNVGMSGISADLLGHGIKGSSPKAKRMLEEESLTMTERIDAPLGVVHESKIERTSEGTSRWSRYSSHLHCQIFAAVVALELQPVVFHA